MRYGDGGGDLGKRLWVGNEAEAPPNGGARAVLYG